MTKENSQSFKRRNHVSLAVVLVGNLAAFAAALRADDFLESIRRQPADVIRDLLPTGAAVLVVSMLNGLLSATAKARIVFMRWSDPLPGARAFSLYAERDPRVDVAALARRFGPLPTGPKEQSALWYKLYCSVENKVQVRDANQQYLLWRDCATLVLLLAVALVPIAAVFTRNIVPVATLFALLALQFGLTVQAARVNGERLVSNVLALKSAEETTSK